MSKWINSLLIVSGITLAIIGQFDSEHEQVFISIGLVFMILGLYRLSKKIPPKPPRTDEH